MDSLAIAATNCRPLLWEVSRRAASIMGSESRAVSLWRDRGGFRIEAQPFTRGPWVTVSGDLVGQRVAYVVGRYAVSFVERGFEGKQAQHPVDGPCDLVHAPLAPCPDRRADVVRRADACAPQLDLQAQVEIGRVDADEHVRRIFAQASQQAAPQLHQAGQVGQHFEQSHDGQLGGVEPGFHSGRFHFLARYPHESRMWKALAQGLHQGSTELVAGGFAGDECNGGVRLGHDGAERLVSG